MGFLSILIDYTIGRGVLILTRLWLKSAIRQIVSTTTIEFQRAPRVITGLAYPNMIMPLRIISRSDVNLEIKQITAEVDFEGVYVGNIFWTTTSNNVVGRKNDKAINIEFAPPLQVFLMKAPKCYLRNGMAKLHCSLGEVIIPFSTDTKEVAMFIQGVTKIKDLL